MWILLYRAFFHPLFSVVLRVVALWSPKVRRGLDGRRYWRRQLAGEGRSSGSGDGAFRVHFHAASVGEFEQAKPLVEALRADGNRYRITASFFSPSGYEQQGGYAALDAACYLPPDRPAETGAFFDLLRPDLVVVIRYDLWPEFMLQGNRRDIPIVLVCGVMREDSTRFRPLIRGLFAKLYGMLRLIHAVGEDDRRAFALLAPSVPAETSGDTRYDRVVARARSAADLPAFTPELAAGRLVLVAGSTWPADEELLAGIASREDLLPVLVPHEPTPDHVTALLERFPGSVTLSAIERGEAPASPRSVVVDRTGILSALYRIGDLAYVGGAFGEGVHSVLEPAAYGMPVLCGPRIGRSRDAGEMHREGALFVVADRAELEERVRELAGEPERREEMGRRVRAFVERRVGGSGRIIGSLRRRGLLPPL